MATTSNPFTNTNVWIEIVFRVILAGLFAYSELGLTPFVRKIQLREWELYLNPYKPDTVPVWFLFSCILLVPIIAAVTAFLWSRKLLKRRGMTGRRVVDDTSRFTKFNLCDSNSFVWCDVIDMLLSFSLACLVSMTFGNFMKYWVGRPRPDFFDRCFNDVSKDWLPEDHKDHEDVRININDVAEVQQRLKTYYSGDEITLQCYGETTYNDGRAPSYINDDREHVLVEGRKSFPSGHSISAGVVFWFAALYLWGKLRAFGPSKRFQSWRFCLGATFIFPLLYTCITRTSDYRHHWQDVTVGALMGILGAWVAYRLYYPALNSRLAHLSYRQQYWILMEDNAPANVKYTDSWNRLRSHIEENIGEQKKSPGVVSHSPSLQVPSAVINGAV